jgi:hypothetical protein
LFVHFAFVFGCCSEIFPLRAKSVGVATTTGVNWCCNLLISFTFLDLCNAVTRFGAFWLYGGVGALGFVWFYFTLPETRGKKLEEIEALFDSVGNKGRSNSSGSGSTADAAERTAFLQQSLSGGGSLNAAEE